MLAVSSGLLLRCSTAPRVEVLPYDQRSVKLAFGSVELLKLSTLATQGCEGASGLLHFISICGAQWLWHRRLSQQTTRQGYPIARLWYRERDAGAQ